MLQDQELLDMEVPGMACRPSSLRAAPTSSPRARAGPGAGEGPGPEEGLDMRVQKLYIVNCTLHFLIANNVLYFPTDVAIIISATGPSATIVVRMCPQKAICSYATSALICFIVIIIILTIHLCFHSPGDRQK